MREEEEEEENTRENEIIVTTQTMNLAINLRALPQKMQSTLELTKKYLDCSHKRFLRSTSCEMLRWRAEAAAAARTQNEKKIKTKRTVFDVSPSDLM